MEKAGIHVRFFFKEKTTGSVSFGRSERKDTNIHEKIAEQKAKKSTKKSVVVE